jgi:hypothetical protein
MHPDDDKMVGETREERMERLANDLLAGVALRV